MVTQLAPGYFFGRTVRSRAVAEITLVETAYSPGRCVPPHEHAAAFFDLVVAGGCAEALGGRKRARGRSTFAFHPAGEVHSSRWQGPDARCFHVEVAPSLLDRVRQYSSGLDHSVEFAAGTPRLLAARLHEEFWGADEASALAIEGLTLELLAECSR
jgi:AraC family transcriptional regulator